jgi:molybdopterin-guanine dinucleotide biosynthesis protein A
MMMMIVTEPEIINSKANIEQERERERERERDKERGRTNTITGCLSYARVRHLIYVGCDCPFLDANLLYLKSNTNK